MLYAHNADQPGLIASTTKIMTALLVAEQCNPDARVKIPPEATGIEGSSMYLTAGEVLTVRDLLYGLMLHSGNDAAVALAIFCAGDVGAFVDRMNQRAGQLGLRQTEFANPNGLDSEHNRSTARDLAWLAACALENDLFREVVSTRTYTNGLRTMTNHNKLLWRYEGAIGVKTGYTRAAGRILVSAAERDGRRLVAVTMSGCWIMALRPIRSRRRPRRASRWRRCRWWEAGRQACGCWRQGRCAAPARRASSIACSWSCRPLFMRRWRRATR